MVATAFLDTNVILRHLLGDHTIHSPAATRLFEQIEARERSVRISETVVFETVFTLEKTYRVPRSEIAAAVLPLLGLPGVAMPGKTMMSTVFGCWSDHAALSFADCYHLVLTQRLGLDMIISFDQGLSRFVGVERIEPA